MLQKLNERIQGIVAWIIIILIAITFTLFGVDYYMQSHQTSDAIATVNKQPISNQAYETSYRRSRSRLNSATTSVADDKQLQKQVLDELIRNEVTVQAAKDYGFEVTQNQATSAILSIPQFQEDGHFSTQRYEQALNAALFTEASFQNEVRQGMLLNQQRFAFIGSSFALASEIERFVKLYMQKRDYDYLTISPSKFSKQVTISPEAIQSYYKAHQKNFFTLEQVSLEYVTLSMSDIKNKIKISEDEINRYYEDNKQNFLTPAQWKVSHILFAIPETALESDIQKIQLKAQDASNKLKQNPKLFKELVTSLSDDKVSIALSGDLPWISGGQKEYDGILSKLTNPGEITTPIRTKNGLEIFQLVDYKPISIKSLIEVAPTIKDQLVSEMAQKKYNKALEQLSDLSYQSPDSLVPVSDALNLKIQKTEPFSRKGGSTDLTKVKQIINAAFNHEVLNLNNNSEPIQINNDALVVIRLSKHYPSKQQSLAEVQEQIEKRLVQEKSEALAKELGSKFLNPLEDKNQSEIMNTYQLQWHTVVRATRDNDKNNSQLNELAFTLLKPGSREGTRLTNGDYAVLLLKQINNGRLDSLDKEQRDSLTQQIETSYGVMDYDLYVNSLMNRSKIVKKHVNVT
ncbi:MAG: SurA N-terminal domain-containing protein [Legionella sp.]|nr:SurA N-terminal domain-containing protein [Legionella sp.]